MSAYQFAAPAVVAVARISRDMAPGKRLDGLKWGLPANPASCQVQILGEDTLPVIQIIDYTFTERHFPGGIAQGAGAPRENNSTNLESEHKLYFFLSVSREKCGFFNYQGLDGESQTRGLLEWTSAIADCLNRSDGDAVDGCLNNTCRSPIFVALRESISKEVAIHAGVELTLFPKPHVRGTITDAMAT